MKTFLDDALNELANAFIVRIEHRRDVTEKLPFQLKKVATADTLMLEGRSFLVVACLKSAVLTANNFLLIRRLADRFNLPIIFALKSIDNGMMSYLHHKGYGWIVPGKASFIPSILVNYSPIDRISNYTLDKNRKSFGIIPSYILAYYLSDDLPGLFSSTDLIQKFDVSKMAISRALKELYTHDLIQEVNGTRPKLFEFCVDKRTLWSKYKDRISSLSTIFITVKLEKIQDLYLFAAGESALSLYTDINPPQQEQVGTFLNLDDRLSLKTITPATMEGDYFFKNMGLYEDIYNGHVKEDKVNLQIFPYKPVLEGNSLNKIFLALSRFDKSDTRVNSCFIELETDIINGFKS
ncbi:hypothetical protein YA29_16485 [Klebsiella aerogenes]|uniref:hypothetical protein n=1 Tax=Klebsiella aerogenes TaxID=548 RepID=UPI00063C952B|nr:hypothetical protein [Klebsiella aerogenes]KLF28681.1 hypothetical protein YA29_16485 [Klebsiella aerogenes]